MPWSIDQLETWVGRPSVDKNGNKLGAIADVYMDDATGNPEWLAVVINGLFTNRVSFVPLAGAEEDGESVRVAYAKSLIKDAPSMELDGDLGAEEEERLYRHYGIPYDGHGTTEAAMQQEGSNSVNNEMTPEMALRRLRRRDEASIGFIELEADDEPTKGAQ